MNKGWRIADRATGGWAVRVNGALGPMKGPALALAIVGMVIAILAWVTAQGAEES